MKHCCLVIREDDRDFIKGVNSPLKAYTNILSGDWSPYFHFDEFQKINGFETDGCVLFSAQESVDAYIDYLMETNQLPAQIVSFFYSQGFMDADNSDDKKPHFHSSPRFLQVLTGNGYDGNSLQDPFNVMRKYGLLPYKDLPFDASIPQSKYLAPISQDGLNKAQLFLAQVGGKNWIQFHWIFNSNAGTAPITDIDKARTETPLVFGVNVGTNWNSTAPLPPPIGSPSEHAVSNYARVPDGEEIVDHYQPFRKLLVKQYPIPHAMQFVINIVPPLAPPVIQTPVTIPATINWLSQLSSWLRNIVESITPQGRAKLGGATRSSQWPQFKKEFAKTHLPVCEVCGGAKGLNLHHLYVFHAYPEYELAEWNVRWLCNEKRCHIDIGHLGDFKSVNPNGIADIQLWRDKRRTRPTTVEEIKKDMPTPPIQ